MCTVSAIDFNNNPAKYLKIAQTEPVMIQDTNRVFELVMAIDEKDYISGEEVVSRVKTYIDEKYADKK